MARLPLPEYHVSVIIRAPLPFVYDWCTDYTPDDLRYGGEKGERRILQQGYKRVVFENLYDVGKGWGWERHVVTLSAPNSWHSEGRGNYFESSLDYKLTDLSQGKTKLNMHWRSRPGPMSRGRMASKSGIERYVTLLWRRRARFIEREFRKKVGH